MTAMVQPASATQERSFAGSFFLMARMEPSAICTAPIEKENFMIAFWESLAVRPKYSG